MIKATLAIHKILNRFLDLETKQCFSNSKKTLCCFKCIILPVPWKQL